MTYPRKIAKISGFNPRKIAKISSFHPRKIAKQLQNLNKYGIFLIGDYYGKKIL